jgi:hypothetical protein
MVAKRKGDAEKLLMRRGFLNECIDEARAGRLFDQRRPRCIARGDRQNLWGTLLRNAFVGIPRSVQPRRRRTRRQILIVRPVGGLLRCWGQRGIERGAHCFEDLFGLCRGHLSDSLRGGLPRHEVRGHRGDEPRACPPHRGHAR